MTAFIVFENVSLRFKVYRNPTPNLKETVVNTLSGRSLHRSVLEFSGLKNVSFSIQTGERVGILGLNGAGKSTLLKAIVGIYSPSEGKISIAGKIVPLIEIGTGFDMELSGTQNIYLNGALLGRSRLEMNNLEQQILDFADIGEFADIPIKYYSTGMLGRLAFSIASMIEPEILLLDEIFSVGDAIFVEKAINKTMKLIETSKIVLMASHDSNLIQNTCTRVFVMHQGQLVNAGAPAEMVDFYNKVIVQKQFISSSPDMSLEQEAVSL